MVPVVFPKHQKIDGSFVSAQLITSGLFYFILKAIFEFEDVTDALGFYGVYHREPWNQVIHFFGVPGILLSILIILAMLPLPFFGNFAFKMPFMPSHTVSWATFTTIMYATFYLKIDHFGGILYFPILYTFYALSVRMAFKDQQLQMKKTSNKHVPWYGTGNLLLIATLIHLFSWYIQIHPGHAILEGAKPAIMDSLGGALTSAPLFAFYEGLWLLGINKPLQHKTLQLVAHHTARLCAEGATMRACSQL